VKRIFITASLMAVTALVFSTAALAQTVPTVPVSAYGDSLLTGLGSAVAAVLPYAAAITAFAIGVGMIRRWLGARKATSV
jgi:hypothetical protein